MGKNVYVVTYDDKWAVRLEGNSGVSKIFRTQAEAIEYGKRLAQINQSELLIQGRDSKFRDRRSYGNDPYPPRG